MLKKQSTEIDPLLEPLLLLTDDERAGDLLSQLITLHAEPVIKEVIRHKLHLNPYRGARQADAGDIQQEAIVQLVAALQQLRERPDAQPVGNLRGLAAVIAHRTYSQWMRRQSPERHAFKRRLYYLLTRQRGFALWRNKINKMVAGFAVWQGREGSETDGRLEQLPNEETLAAQIRLLKTDRRADWGDALAAIFNYLGGPIEFDKLVAALVALLGVADQPIEFTDQIDAADNLNVSGQKPDMALQVEQRIFLQRLWEEVRQLPLNQRMALLLNLRDHKGKGCIALFPAIGIATFRQLAEALDLEAEKLAEIWNDLPLEDARIADLLRLTRQQVINARKSARERLGRRLKGLI
jgi:DNA-directed RNA polymerase specialized sigma24 family protein